MFDSAGMEEEGRHQEGNRAGARIKTERGLLIHLRIQREPLIWKTEEKCRFIKFERSLK